MTLKHPPVDTLWRITQSHTVRVPDTLASDTLEELRCKVQAIARERRYGEISFRYEVDDTDLISRVHCYFDGPNNIKRRFLRLERIAP